MKIRSTAGITTVEVLPTHRRQGMLTEMMRFQLADLRERGEFLAVLLAAEWQIHGRFGYGPATFDHDLVTEVAFKHFPTDHPLRWQLADVNAGQLSGEMDWLWVRLLDVSRALATRGYRTGGDLVLEVHDPFLGEHDRYLPSVRGGEAECVGTGREPDLSLDVRDLASIYLTRAARRRPRGPTYSSAQHMRRTARTGSDRSLAQSMTAR
ncbi:hypothetical protein GCM10022267_07620 [Lentzea roselyniae]|uniref:Enhanced intracellular survival protein domain-containing protein n=1 Tax=Lentzea roselyniae TaxID=531940 RepID=A0ABP7A346_9PSEU